MGVIMKQVCVDLEFVQGILGASYRTALNHRGMVDEMYALGALEAISNFIYIMAVNSQNADLETMSQKFASDALDRYTELCRSLGVPEDMTGLSSEDDRA